MKAVFVVAEKMTEGGARTFWTRIGKAYDNKDGSTTLKLDALPLSGTLQVREEDPRYTPRHALTNDQVKDMLSGVVEKAVECACAEAAMALCRTKGDFKRADTARIALESAIAAAYAAFTGGAK